jgi:hypothetical protein
LGIAGLAPSLTSYTLAFALQLRKKHGKTSVRVAARTSQTDTVQYTNNEQYKTQKKNCNRNEQVRADEVQRVIVYRLYILRKVEDDSAGLSRWWGGPFASWIFFKI